MINHENLKKPALTIHDLHFKCVANAPKQSSVTLEGIYNMDEESKVEIPLEQNDLMINLDKF